MTEPDRAQLRSFTGDKLDWLSALSADPRLDARAFQVGFQVAQHVNAQTGVAILSDETIGDKTGIARRWVQRARNALRVAGWIDWKRTKTANVYWTLGGQINQVMDRQIVLKEERQERRQCARMRPQELPPVAHLKLAETPPVAHPELPPVAHRDVPPMANIHLQTYTLDITPSKESLSGRKDSLPRIQHHQTAETYLVTELGDGDVELGLKVSDIIGRHRFDFLLGELKEGTLHRSALVSARDVLRSEGVAA